MIPLLLNAVVCATILPYPGIYITRPSINIKQVLGLVEPFIYEEVAKLRGSISAEHGLGLKKANYLK